MVRRILNSFAVISLLLASQLPLWRIEIQAPQYPEGLSLKIGFDSISGNVDQINILNHYIGMKRIEPNQIPELKMMPKILIALCVFGAIVVITNSIILNFGWLASLLVAGLIGMYDFFLWGYDYGHNLNPNAPIRIPGLTYQPPLIGHKTLLNIDSYSLPDWGTLALVLSLIFVATAVNWAKISQLKWDSGTFNPKALPALLFILLNIAGCTSKPEQIHAGQDSCHECHMTISDARFGGEILTAKGRAQKFDSIECMMKAYARMRKDGDSDRLFVADYFSIGSLVPVESARFLSSNEIHAPMGPGVLATVDSSTLKEFKAKLQKAEDFDWQGIQSRFSR